MAGVLSRVLLSVAVVGVWVVGRFFVQKRFSNEVYQLVINTTTTVITFIMVFIIENTQNRDGRAIQTTLDAQNEALAKVLERLEIGDVDHLLTRLIGVDDAPEREIKAEQDHVRSLARPSSAEVAAG